MAVIFERYNPLPVPANTTLQINSDHVGGFLCTTGGTLTITANSDLGVSVTIINALAVTAGVYYPFPFYIGKNGGTVTTGGGAIGTLGT